jgi:single-stranded-DNA-specific exonuclease
MKWMLPEKRNEDVWDLLLSERGIDDIDKFLNPSISQLYDPFLIYGMDDAVKVISNAIKSQTKIYIHGDFDVDGITATSILWNYLYKDLGATVLPFIPNRFTDGYGLSEETIKNMIKEGGGLVISVDCGIKDIELVNKYADQIDFVITDHHSIRNADLSENIEGSKSINGFLISSRAKAVVHPGLDPKYPFKDICGALVSWKLVHAINNFLKQEIDIYKYLELAAIGTVCDIMPLIDENRIVVSQGLKRMATTQNAGLKALAQVSGVDLNVVDTYSIGFMLGPRLNAAGRIESALDAVRLLTTSSYSFALELANKLESLNKERQELTKKFLDLSEEQIQSQLNKKVIFIYGKDWPEGIVGLIAGKLTEKYSRPVLIGSLNENGIIKASARSIPGFHITDKLKINEHLLNTFGGHAQAAGLTLNESNFSELVNNLNQIADEELDEEKMVKSISVDLVVNINQLNLDLAEKINLLAPFGYKNSKPNIVVAAINLKKLTYVGKESQHVKFCIADNGNEINCISFNAKDKFDSVVSNSINTYDVLGNLDIDSWNGYKKIILKIIDIRESNK